MRAGTLRHRVTLEDFTETETVSGDQIKTWAAYAEVWASVEPLQAREFTAAKQIAADVTHRVTLRYLDGVDTKMRVNHGGRYLYVTAVINTDERDRELVLMCREDV